MTKLLSERPDARRIPHVGLVAYVAAGLALARHVVADRGQERRETEKDIRQ